MLTIVATERFTGVHISGDYWDFEAIADAIDYLVGNENKYYDFQGSRSRLKNLTRLFRLSMRMERDIEFVPNGTINSIMIEKGMLAPETNVYYSFYLLQPELIFTALALNDFIKLHEKIEDPRTWNVHIANARLYQALVADHLQRYLPVEEYKAFMEAAHSITPLYFRYASQYVDILNVEFIHMDEEERYKSISNVAARLVHEDPVYISLKNQLLLVTSTTKNAIHELPLNIEYPEEIEW